MSSYNNYLISILRPWTKYNGFTVNMLKEEKDLYTIIKIYTCTCTVVDCSTTLY